MPFLRWKRVLRRDEGSTCFFKKSTPSSRKNICRNIPEWKMKRAPHLAFLSNQNAAFSPEDPRPPGESFGNGHLTGDEFLFWPPSTASLARAFYSQTRFGHRREPLLRSRSYLPSFRRDFLHPPLTTDDELYFSQSFIFLQPVTVCFFPSRLSAIPSPHSFTFAFITMWVTSAKTDICPQPL